MIAAQILVLTAAISVAAAPLDAYPAASVFEEVRGLCSSLTAFDDTVSRAKSRGWQLTQPTKRSPLAKRINDLTAMSKEGGAKIRSAVFRKVAAGETLHAFLYEERSKDSYSVGCQIYDIDEARSIPRVEIERLVGSPASGNDSFDSGNIMMSWRRNAPLGDSRFEYAYFPAGGFEVIFSGLSGIRFATETSTKVH